MVLREEGARANSVVARILRTSSGSSLPTVARRAVAEVHTDEKFPAYHDPILSLHMSNAEEGTNERVKGFLTDTRTLDTHAHGRMQGGRICPTLVRFSGV